MSTYEYINHLTAPSGKKIQGAGKDIFPGYTLKSVIGSGGFAEVYLAVDKNSGDEVALKIPKRKDKETAGPEIFKQFRSESEIWRPLVHKNIVRFIKNGSAPISFIVMEYMGGGNLRNLMNSHSLSLDEARFLMRQILQGLSYAHRMARVHRDLKPENILFSSDGEAKITDWGIGKFMASAKVTETLGLSKTVCYSAPEQSDPRKYGKIDWQTDIFQTGILFYEMLTGKNPIYSDYDAGIINNLLHAEIPPPSSLNAKIPTELDDVVMTALERRKEDRWRSGDVMLDRLRGSKGIVGKPQNGQKIYRQFLSDALGDGYISADEKRMLAGLRKQYGISEEVHDLLVVEIKEKLGINKQDNLEKEVSASFKKLEDIYKKAKQFNIDTYPYRLRFRKSKRWVKKKRYKKADLQIQKLLKELKKELSAYGDHISKKLKAKRISLEKELKNCSSMRIEMKMEEDKYFEAMDLEDCGKPIEALILFGEIERALKNKLRDHKKRKKKQKELLTELRKLSKNNMNVPPPSNLARRIKSNPFSAEAEIDSYHKRINSKRKRKQQKKRARDLQNKLQSKISYCVRKDFKAFGGFNRRAKRAKDLFRSRQFSAAIAAFEKLIPELDDHIKEKELDNKPLKKVNDHYENSIGMKFVKIPGKNYYMGKYTVTQKEWKAVMRMTPWKGKAYVKEGDDYPANYISWNDCQEFVKRLNRKEGGNKYRLPTEEEWEHACRAGSTANYCFGDNLLKLREYAWFNNLGNTSYGDNPKKVGQKKPNKWGLYDMHGNVGEWCQDFYKGYKDSHVCRGGAWVDTAASIKSTSRNGDMAAIRHFIHGVRLVRFA